MDRDIVLLNVDRATLATLAEQQYWARDIAVTQAHRQARRSDSFKQWTVFSAHKSALDKLRTDISSLDIVLSRDQQALASRSHTHHLSHLYIASAQSIDRNRDRVLSTSELRIRASVILEGAKMATDSRKQLISERENKKTKIRDGACYNSILRAELNFACIRLACIQKRLIAYKGLRVYEGLFVV
mmetsp:Transcript_18465/g.57697  ORF Transcript_18465/g.57697 Transcript_18465/m.57697 type:complete len:186 (-) Transcript_18465:261-818(-)